MSDQTLIDIGRALGVLFIFTSGIFFVIALASGSFLAMFASVVCFLLGNGALIQVIKLAQSSAAIEEWEKYISKKENKP